MSITEIEESKEVPKKVIKKRPAKKTNEKKAKKPRKVNPLAAISGPVELKPISITERSDPTNMKMKIISINVNGIRAATKKPAFKDFLEDQNADIICFQETKAEEKQNGFKLGDFGYKHLYWNSSKTIKGYAGTLVASKIKPINVTYGDEHFSDTEGRLITLEFDDFFLINAYVCNSGDGLKFMDKRKNWDVKMRDYLQELDEKKPTIFAGDLNVAVLDYDVYDGETNKKRKLTAGFTDAERSAFKGWLNDGFVDVYRHFYPDARGHESYTFWSYRGGMKAKGKGWRLDYFLVSPCILPNVKKIEILTEQNISDHVPLVLTLG